MDIAIEVVGRRPGEKIHEELFEPAERPQPTPAEKIVAAVRPRLDPEWVESAFARIEELVYDGDAVGAGGRGGRAVRRARAGRLGGAGGSGRRPRLTPALRSRRPHYSSRLRIYGDHRADRVLRGARGGRRTGRAVGALLLAGARREAPARMGRPGARAHRRAREPPSPSGWSPSRFPSPPARLSRRPGLSPRAAPAGPGRQARGAGAAAQRRRPRRRLRQGPPPRWPPARPRPLRPPRGQPAAAPGVEEPPAAPARAPTAPTSRRPSPRTP